jgi:hypothetical protein
LRYSTSPLDAIVRWAERLAKGIFSTPGVYPAVARFANADSKANSDFKSDVWSLSFSVDLTQGGAAVPGANVGRQDFSLQNARTLPINDSAPPIPGMGLTVGAIGALCQLLTYAVHQPQRPLPRSPVCGVGRPMVGKSTVNRSDR